MQGEREALVRLAAVGYTPTSVQFRCTYGRYTA
jgi:hypothetical protein